MKKYKPLLSLFLAVCVSCMSFLCVPIVAKAADDGEISNEYLYDKTYLEDGTVILYEDEEFYGEFERRFVCEDGLYVVATYPEPINYQTDKGEWRRIDNSLKRVGDRFENVDSSLYVSFAENSRDENLVHLSNNDIDFS